MTLQMSSMEATALNLGRNEPLLAKGYKEREKTTITIARYTKGVCVNLNGAKAVLLLWHKEQRKIAILPVDPGTKGSRKLTYRRRRKRSITEARLDAAMFFRRIRYIGPPKRTFDATCNEQFGVLEMILPEP